MLMCISIVLNTINTDSQTTQYHIEMEITSIIHYYHILPNCRVWGSNLNKINPLSRSLFPNSSYVIVGSLPLIIFIPMIFTVIQYFSLFEGWITSYITNGLFKNINGDSHTYSTFVSTQKFMKFYIGITSYSSLCS